MADLASRAVVSSSFELPARALTRIYIPGPTSDVRAHVGIAGYDRQGTLVAIGAVRIVEDAGRTVAAIRAMTDPAWHGRGIGRALLAWQDAWALRELGEGDSAIGVPIVASAIERRRLYAAAGFSAATRIEVVERRLGDAHEAVQRTGERAAAAGWPVRELRPTDTDALVPILTDPTDPFGFMLRALTTAELVELADPALSSVVEHDGQVAGGMLVAELPRPEGPRTALVLGLGLRDGGDDVARGLLAEQCERLWAAGIETTSFALTPATAQRWARPLASLACVSTASNPLYTIELP